MFQGVGHLGLIELPGLWTLVQASRLALGWPVERRFSRLSAADLLNLAVETEDSPANEVPC